MSTSSTIMRPLLEVTVKVGLGQHFESIGDREIVKGTDVGSPSSKFMVEGSAIEND